MQYDLFLHMKYLSTYDIYTLGYTHTYIYREIYMYIPRNYFLYSTYDLIYKAVVYLFTINLFFSTQ